MANHALPTTASTYANFVTELQARIDDAVKESSTGASVTLTNPPTNMVRWNATNFYWEINTGTPAAPVWGVRSARYDININGTVGATTANSGAFTTLTVGTSASLPTSTTIGGVAAVTASNTVTLTNKTLTAPVISSIVNNTYTLTLPSTATDTLVGRATTDTLTNKSFTAPRITSASSIQDGNGVALIAVPTAIASAVNYLTVNNSVTGTAPSIVATGSDANLGLNLVPKGTGTVQANGVDLVTLSATQTLTNKVLTGNTIGSFSNGSNTITAPAPGANDTLISRTSTDTLTNKTWNGATIGLAYGGTGATSAQAAINALAGSVTSGSYLRGNGTNILMSSIAAADVPTLNQNTTGTAAGLSATLAVGSGGTGATTAQGAINNLAGSVTSGSYLRGNGTNILMSSIAAADVPTLNQNTTGTAAGLSATLAVGSGGTGQTSLANVAVGTATNLANGVAGGIPYQSGVGTTSMLGAGTSGQVLKSGGTGAPTWGTAGSLLNVQVFNATGTYTPTAGTGKIWVEVLGPGAPGIAGGTTMTTQSGQTVTYWNGLGGNGGAGGCRRGIFSSSPATTTVTVGASGGTSAFGTLITAVGTGVTGTGGNVIEAGGAGSLGLNIRTAQSPWGSVGGHGGTGGGAGGAGGASSTAGTAALANSGGGGGGGGGAYVLGKAGGAAGAGGAGGSGQVVVYEFV